jgi:hypothetical protein
VTFEWLLLIKKCQRVERAEIDITQSLDIELIVVKNVSLVLVDKWRKQ